MSVTEPYVILQRSCTHLNVPYFLSFKLMHTHIHAGLSCSVRKRASTSTYLSQPREKKAMRNSGRSLRLACVHLLFWTVCVCVCVCLWINMGGMGVLHSSLV